MATEFHLKYRPKLWKEVLGQKTVVRSLVKVLDQKRNRTFLLTGPSGVGKTTIARLIATHVGCEPAAIIEIDGATNTGIDDMREVAARLQYASIDGSPRCVIVDEVHAVSRQAFQSLLKVLEEPPPDVYWVLCTTEADRVPNQIKTRCAVYNLKAVGEDEIYNLLKMVKGQEELTIADDDLKLVVSAAEGSVRQSLVYLAECGDLSKSKSIMRVLEKGSDPKEVIDLCRLMLSVASGDRVKWKAVAELLRSLDISAESARIIVLRYMNSVMLSGNTQKAGAAMSVMDCFDSPFLDREGLAPLTMACARVWSQEVEQD